MSFIMCYLCIVFVLSFYNFLNTHTDLFSSFIPMGKVYHDYILIYRLKFRADKIYKIFILFKTIRNKIVEACII